MHPVLGTMMPKICEAPHLPTSRFQPSLGSAFKEWGAFISFSWKMKNACEKHRYHALVQEGVTMAERVSVHACPLGCML